MPAPVERLRIYKSSLLGTGTGGLHWADTYTELTGAQDADYGYEDLTVIKTLNEAGEMKFNIVPVTPGEWDGIINEGARVELWREGSRAEVFLVDDLAYKWSLMQLQVSCSGVMALGERCPVSFVTDPSYMTTGQDLIGSIVAAVPAWTSWGVRFTGTAYLGELAVSWEGKDAPEALKEVALMLGLVVRFDNNGQLVVSDIAATQYTFGFAAGGNGLDFDARYTSGDVVNQLTLRGYQGRVWGTYEDADSQALYGLSAVTIDKAWIDTQAEAEVYAALYLAYTATPKVSPMITAPYNALILPGVQALVTGLGDTRDYTANVHQVTWDIGARLVDVSIGVPPLSLKDQIDPGDPGPGDGGGDGGDDGGAGLPYSISINAPESDGWGKDREPGIAWTLSGSSGLIPAGTPTSGLTFTITVSGSSRWGIASTARTYEWPTTLNTGVHWVQVRAFKSGVLVGDSEKTTFNIDVTPPPTFGLTSPADWASVGAGDTTFDWADTVDADSGLDRYELWVNGALRESSEASNVQGSLDAGTHTWNVRAYDKAGNLRVSNTTRTLVVTPADASTMPTAVRRRSICFFIGGTLTGTQKCGDFTMPDGVSGTLHETKSGCIVGSSTITFTKNGGALGTSFSPGDTFRMQSASPSSAENAWGQIDFDAS